MLADRLGTYSHRMGILVSITQLGDVASRLNPWEMTMLSLFRVSLLCGAQGGELNHWLLVHYYTYLFLSTVTFTR